MSVSMNVLFIFQVFSSGGLTNGMGLLLCLAFGGLWQVQPRVNPPLAEVPGLHQELGGEEPPRQGQQDDSHQKGKGAVCAC